MINYLCTSPIPKIKTTDAVYNEISLLDTYFNKEKEFITSLYPFSKPSSKYPIILFGLHNLYRIKQKEKCCNINHIFSSGLFHLPFIRFLSKPTVLTVTTRIQDKKRIPINFIENHIELIIVSSQEDKEFLERNTSKKVHFFLPVIQTNQFEVLKRPELKSTNSTFKILYASAPWELKQFNTKCIEILLQALAATKNLKMIFLWRGILHEQMIKLINKYKVEDKITLINEHTDVSKVMESVHCTILLSKRRDIVKSYPHSLVESIAAKRPVITNSLIPIQDYIKKNNYGYVLEEITLNEVKIAITNMMHNYHMFVNNIENRDQSYFSNSMLLDRLNKIYSKTYS